MPSAQVQLVRVEVGRRWPLHAILLVRCQLGPQRAGNLERHVGLVNEIPHAYLLLDGGCRRATRDAFTPHAPAQLTAMSCELGLRSNAGIAADSWDGRRSREAVFIAHVRTRLPRMTVRDLTPMLDSRRNIKSPREIVLIRESSDLAPNSSRHDPRLHRQLPQRAEP